jgi:FixJ family two-component response regulator
VTVNEMLQRLQTERWEATGRVLAAQEAERLRIAQELHGRIAIELRPVADLQAGADQGRALIISEKTVERHRADILEKLGMRDRVDLTRYAIQRGLVEP